MLIKENSMEGRDIIRNDFDRIARLKENIWDHNIHYNEFLLKHLPCHFENALDIDSGTGGFARLLAEKAKNVTALDLSFEMIKTAEELSESFCNIEYRVQDIMEYMLEEKSYYCISSIATIHHLPLKEVLERISKALKPGGVCWF